MGQDQKNNNLQKISIIILAIFSLIGLVGIFLRGVLPPFTPNSDIWARFVTTPIYGISGIVMIVAYCIPFIGFHGLLEILKTQSQSKIIYWAYFLCIFGTVFTLPMLGLVHFIFPVLGANYLAGNHEVIDLITQIFQGPTIYLSLGAGILYFIGPLLFAALMWKTTIFSKITAFLFGIHGILLSIGFSFFPLLVVGWSALFISACMMILEIRKTPE